MCKKIAIVKTRSKNRWRITIWELMVPLTQAAVFKYQKNGR